MNQEIKLKLEEAAETAWEQDQKTNPSPVNPHAYVYGYKAGAQNILDNPSEWGLVCRIEASEHLRDTDSAWEDALAELKSQNKRYREALEKIAIFGGLTSERLAKEALKQHGDEKPI